MNMISVRRTVYLSAAVLAVFLLGCGQGDKGFDLKRILTGGPKPSEQVVMTFDTEDPDRRREGIELLSRKPWGLKEPYLKGYALLLRSDSEPLVRCAAVRALGKSGDTDYLPNVIASLSDQSPSVRWDAAVALDQLIGVSAIEPLRRHATSDSSVDVRIACAKALRHYPTGEVFYTLVQCLSDAAFGVRYRAHGSLVELTGRDVGLEPDEWSLLGEEALTPDPSGEFKRPWWDMLRLTKPPSR